MRFNQIGVFFFKLLIGVFRVLPFSVIHLFSNILAFLFEYVIRYRKKVIINNLLIAFPSKSLKERKAIMHQTYLALSDNFLETIKSFSISEKELKKRMVFTNPDFLDQYFVTSPSHVIVLGGHFYSWELGVLGAQLYVKQQMMGVYKPLSNKLLNDYLNKRRHRFGSELMSMNQTFRTILKNKNRDVAYVFIADQSPSNVKSAHWLNFFGKNTGFLQGADKIARSTGYPVLYYTITRTKRGYYELTFSELCAAPQSLKEGEVTRLFAQKLEENIKADPVGWLWSHRRWKRTPNSEGN